MKVSAEKTKLVAGGANGTNGDRGLGWGGGFGISALEQLF